MTPLLHVILSFSLKVLNRRRDFVMMPPLPMSFHPYSCSHVILSMTSLIGLMYKVRSIQQAETKHFSSTIHVDTGQTSSPNTQNSPSTTRDGHISTQSTFNTNSSGVNYLTIARNPSLMTISTVMSFLFALIMHLRILIGRKQFPCFLYKLVYHLAVPSMSTTIILRTMRVAMLGLLNRLKVKIGQREMENYFNGMDRNTCQILLKS